MKSKISGKKLNLKNYLNSGEINNSKSLWLQISQEELINSGKFENFKNSMRLKEDEIGLYRCTLREFHKTVRYLMKPETLLVK